MRFIAETAQETKDFARRWAERLTGGELLLLEGDLGAGKTTFVQGLAEGLGAEVGASSPTFVLERRYPGRLELIHLDLYRMEDEREAALLVGEALSEALTVVAVEWADKFPAIFTDYDALRISFREKGEARELDVTATGPAGKKLLSVIPDSDRESLRSSTLRDEPSGSDSNEKDPRVKPEDDKERLEA